MSNETKTSDELHTIIEKRALHPRIVLEVIPSPTSLGLSPGSFKPLVPGPARFMQPSLVMKLDAIGIFEYLHRET